MTELVVAASEATVAVLAFVAILIGSRDTRRARVDAESAEQRRALERHSDYEAGIVLQVAEAYEQWVMGHGGDELGMTDEGPLIRPRARRCLGLRRWQVRAPFDGGTAGPDLTSLLPD